MRCEPIQDDLAARLNLMCVFGIDPSAAERNGGNFAQPVEPEIHQIRVAFIESAAAEIVRNCLKAADLVAASVTTLPPTEARRYVQYVGDMLAVLQARLSASETR